MSEDQYQGLEDQAAGAANGYAEEPATEAPKGSGKRVAGKIRQTAGRLENAIGATADQATSAVSRLTDRAAVAASTLTDRAQAVYGRAAERAQQTADQVEPFVHARPYTALGIAASVGLVLGMLLTRPKVIYVRPAHH